MRASKLAATIVRPGTFMEMLLQPHFGLAQGTFVFFVRPDQRIQLVAVEDIGKLVARDIELARRVSAAVRNPSGRTARAHETLAG